MSTALSPRSELKMSAVERLLDALSDAVLVLDTRGVVRHANPAARRLLGVTTGFTATQLNASIGAPAVQWLQRALHGTGAASVAAPNARLNDGRSALLGLLPLDAQRYALHVSPLASSPAAPTESALVPLDEDATEVMRMIWESSFPATLQDLDYRLVAVNRAYVDFTGYPESMLIGMDPLGLQPEEDRAVILELRRQMPPSAQDGSPAALVERRLVDAAGRERWFRAMRRRVRDAKGRTLLLSLLQDATEDHQSRHLAERSMSELEQWLDLSPLGMLLIDAGGLIVRSNPAFEAMVGAAPVSVADASPALRALLGWDDRGPRAELLPGGAPLQIDTVLPMVGGGERHLRATVRCAEADARQRRYLAVIEDRSIVDERDLAQSQLGTLVDAAGVGVATFHETRGWLLSGAPAAPSGAPGGALQAVGRDIVEPASLPEFERLQRALRDGERTEVRYAVRHPEVGTRWLLTRVAPGPLATGLRTTSVVTLDVTDQQLSTERSEQLRRELQAQAERTRAVLDSVLIGIVMVDAGGIQWMNRSAQRMFGGELQEFRGLPIATVATDDADHPLRRTDLLAQLAEGQAETFECRLRARDGRMFRVAGNVVLTGRDGDTPQLSYSLLDIDRRLQAEAASAQTQASLKRIIDAAPLLIVLHDAATLEVLQANPVAQRVLGRAEAEIVGRPPEQVYPAELAGAWRADLQAALSAADQPLLREYRLPGPQGKPRILEARHLATRLSQAERPDQLLTIAADVTEQREAEAARLEAAIAQRELLVREVHHRIKNNLQGVAGLLQQIAQRRPEVAPVIAEAIGQVQAIAQVYGLQVGAAGPLRVKSVVEAIVGSVQRLHGRPIGIRIDGDAAHRWALPEIESIPIALLLNELLNNAVKHGRDGAIGCTLAFGDAGLSIAIDNPGALPAGFELARVPVGVSGLGLVRALLPRRGATLTFRSDAVAVVAAVELKPPAVTRLEPL